MILQWRLPYDVPNLGREGDVATFYAAQRRVERVQELPSSALEVLAAAIPGLVPVGPALPAEVAVAMVRASVPERPARRRLRAI